MKYLLVDAGGTKTKAVVYDEETKSFLNTFVGKSGSYAVKHEEALHEIKRVIASVFTSEVKAIGIGASGIGACRNIGEFKNCLVEEFKVPVFLENDAYIALYSILKDTHIAGALVLSGTGSSVLTKNGKDAVLTGGWGHLLTEEGSAYKIAIDAFKKAIYDFEEGLPNSKLTVKLLTSLGLKEIVDIKKFVYRSDKAEIAKGSIVVREMAMLGDEDALSVIESAGKFLARDVIHGARKLNLQEIYLGFRGGYIERDKILQSLIVKNIEKEGFKVLLESDPTDPIMGAYYMIKNGGK